MTTNHPAHGPVSLDRLHQISEILSKAAAQSDGGNLGYAMADAVKAIDELLSGRKTAAQEAVYQVLDDGSWTDYSKQQLEVLLESKPSTLFRVAYPSPSLTQPAPVVPEEMYWQDEPVEGSTRAAAYATGWNACRAAMLQGNYRDLSQPVDPQVAEYEEMMNQAGNSPVIPDRWIPVSEQMPADGDIVLVVDDGYFVCEAQYRDGDFYSAVRGNDEFFETTCRDVELWMPLPAAPQQEVKRNDAQP